MPEGDTIHRTARALGRALTGREVVRFEAPRLTFVPFATGTRVIDVEALGKHCLVRFDDGRTLHTHLRMTGSWHLYRPGERWQKKPAAARAVVEVAGDDTNDGRGWVAVCFAAPVVELTTEPPVAHLGPDLTRPDADVDEAARRLAALPPGTELGVALLDQRVAAGIGNIYKSEACFAAGIHPFTAVGDLGHDDRRRVLTVAAEQLRRNVDRVDRDTTGGRDSRSRPGLAVYGRRHRPCRRCGTPVAWARQGDDARGTYWCPSCQPGPGSTPAGPG